MVGIYLINDGTLSGGYFWNCTYLKCYTGNTDKKLRKKYENLRNKDFR